MTVLQYSPTVRDTTPDAIPTPPSHGDILCQAPIAPFRSLCPNANSKRKIGKPSTNNMMKQGIKKAPPPFFCAKQGNLHTFPKSGRIRSHLKVRRYIILYSDSAQHSSRFYQPTFNQRRSKNFLINFYDGVFAQQIRI